MSKEEFEELNGFVDKIVIRRNKDGFPTVVCKYTIDTPYGAIKKSLNLVFNESDTSDIMAIDQAIAEKFFNQLKGE